MTHFSMFVGIDVSKDRLDVYCHPSGLAFHTPNTAEGLATLISRTAGPSVVWGCEATGGLENRLLIAMHNKGLPCLCLHPVDVRAFARLKGKRAKTDKIDAMMIARSLVEASDGRKPMQRTYLQCKIKELATLRRRLNAFHAQLSSLKALMQETDAIEAVEAVIANLEAAIKRLADTITATISEDEQARNRSGLIRSVPGAGKILAAELIASMPELGTLNSKQAASLIGLAPHPRKSGKKTLPSRCQGGRNNIRRILYMAALSAIKAKKEPFIKNYQRLRENGKPFKVAIVAIMRKLIVTINAVVKADKKWTIKYS